jgi:CheY-like chemotaxis protein
LEILGSDPDAATTPPGTNLEPPAGRTLLVVAGEADVRGYVAECLRPRTDLGLVVAASADAAVSLARRQPPDLIIVAGPEADAARRLPTIPAILLADEATEAQLPATTGTGAPRLLLGMPFNAQGLIQYVDQLLGADPDSR